MTDPKMAIAPRPAAPAVDVSADRDYWKQRAAGLEHDRDALQVIVTRVTERMEEYDRHGSRMVNVRQVINLLSPTWPDGNYAEPAFVITTDDVLSQADAEQLRADIQITARSDGGDRG